MAPSGPIGNLCGGHDMSVTTLNETEDKGLEFEARQRARNRRRITMGRLAAGLALLALWQFAYMLLGRHYFSAPLHVVERIWALAIEGSLWRHTWITVYEAVAGFALGGIPAVILPFLLRLSPRLIQALDPFITVAMGIPKLALAPLLILWFGIGLFSKIVFVASLVFFIIFFNTLAGARSTSPSLLSTARVMGAGEWRIAREIVWYTALPFVFAGMKIALPRALSAAVVAEFIASSAGIGYYINNSRAIADTVGLFAGVVVITLIVLVLNALLQKLQARALAWRPVSRDMVV